MDNSTMDSEFAITNGLPLGMALGREVENRAVDTTGDSRLTEYEKEQQLVQGTKEESEVRREKMEAEDMKIK